MTRGDIAKIAKSANVVKIAVHVGQYSLDVLRIYAGLHSAPGPLNADVQASP